MPIVQDSVILKPIMSGATRIVLFIALAVGILFLGHDYNKRLDERAAADAVRSQAQVAAEQARIMSSFKKEDVKVGLGREAAVGDIVGVQYIGSFDDGKEFDNSYKRGEPFTFKLGAGEVIPGWDMGVQGMKVGGKRKLTIPPELGYGDRGSRGGEIPPNSTLHFTVELLSVGGGLK